MAKTQLDVEEVMGLIRDSVKAKKIEISLAEDNNKQGHRYLDFADDLYRLDIEISQNNINALTCTSDFPITSHRKITGKFIVFGKKLLRKLLRWYIDPIIERQIEYNMSTDRSLSILAELAQKQFKQQQEMLAKIERLETELSAATNAELKSQ